MTDGRWAMPDGRWAMTDGRWAMVEGRGPGFVRTAHALGQLRQPRLHRRQIVARTRDDDEVRQVEDGGVTHPRGNFCKRVRAGDEESLRRGETACVQPL